MARWVRVWGVAEVKALTSIASVISGSEAVGA